MKTNLFTALTCLIMGMSFSSLFAADKAAPKETTIVIAEGVGANAVEAKLKALRNAVQQVVGVIIDAETLIKNEKVVKDEILDFSNGYVQSHTVLAEGKNKDGLYEVTINATVQRRQLIGKLKKSKNFKGDLDGASLFWREKSEEEAQRKGAALLDRTISGMDLPSGLIKIRVANNEPERVDKTPPNITYQWELSVTMDQDQYRDKVFPKLKQILDGIAIEVIDPDAVRVESRKLLQEMIPAGFAHFEVAGRFSGKKKGIPVYLINNVHEIHGYLVDERVAEMLNDHVGGDKAGILSAVLELKNRQKTTVFKDTRLMSGIVRRQNVLHRPIIYKSRSGFLIMARFRSTRMLEGWNFSGDKISFKWDVKVPLRLMENVKTIECRVIDKPATKSVEITRGPDGRWGINIGVFRRDYGGVVIESTFSGYPASRVGLSGIIIKANGQKIKSQAQLLEILRSNDKLELTVK